MSRKVPVRQTRFPRRQRVNAFAFLADEPQIKRQLRTILAKEIPSEVMRKAPSVRIIRTFDDYMKIAHPVYASACSKIVDLLPLRTGAKRALAEIEVGTFLAYRIVNTPGKWMSREILRRMIRHSESISRLLRRGEPGDTAMAREGELLHGMMQKLKPAVEKDSKERVIEMTPQISRFLQAYLSAGSHYEAYLLGNNQVLISFFDEATGAALTRINRLLLKYASRD